VPDLHAFDYAIVRVVPRVERGEFVNAGVILFSRTARFLCAKIEVNLDRVAALAPDLDSEVVTSYLDAIPRICEGGTDAIGSLSQSERFHWLVAPRSTIIQTSPVHSGVHHDMQAALETLLTKLVR
jgi:hypothetical protein